MTEKSSAAAGPSVDALAVDGGTPLRREPLPPWPAFGEEELEAVATVLRSGKVNYWTGRHGRLFEEEFARFTGCRHAVAVANGTVALELALHALGIGPGDEVIVPARSFVASASCCETRGATAIFADVDPDSQNLTAETIRAVLSRKTKAIIAVHLAGWPCEMGPIMELADRHGLYVIEDCAQAQGATYRGRPVGSLGHAAAFSFCQDKIITTGGEGGMMTTNCHAAWKRAWSYKDHGKDWDAVGRPNPDHVFQWLHATIGTNWRLTEMQSALGRAALRKLPAWLAARRANAALLHERLAQLAAVRIPVPPAHVEHACYKQYLFLRLDHLRPGWSRDRVARAIQAEGIACGSGTCPEIYLEAAFAGREHRDGERLPNARLLGQTSLMLQVHPTLKRRDVADVCRAVEKVIAAATTASESGQVVPLDGRMSPVALPNLPQVA